MPRRRTFAQRNPATQTPKQFRRSAFAMNIHIGRLSIPRCGSYSLYEMKTRADIHVSVRLAALAMAAGIAVSGTVASRAYADTPPPPIDQLNEGSFLVQSPCFTTQFTYSYRFVVLSDATIEINGLAIFQLGKPPTVQPALAPFTELLFPDGTYQRTGYATDATTITTGTWTGAFTHDAKGSHFSYSTTSAAQPPCTTTVTGTYGPVPPGF